MTDVCHKIRAGPVYTSAMKMKTIRDRNGLPILHVQEGGGQSDLVFDRKGNNVGSLSARGTSDSQGRQISPDREPGLLASIFRRGR